MNLKRWLMCFILLFVFTATAFPAVQIQLRRDSAADWTSENPTLAEGEFGYETDTSKFKIGDGATAWTSLAYISGLISSDIDTSAELNAIVVDNTGSGVLVFNNGPTMTDLTVGTSLTIPSAANPTVDEDGEIAIDTTVGQIVYMSGATARIIYPQAPRCVAVENLAAADDNMSMGSFGQAVTVERVWCYFRGTGTTPATIKLHDSLGNDFTHDTVNCYFGLATPLLVSANNALVATETFEFDTTNAVSPETDEYTICVDYLYTRQ